MTDPKLILDKAIAGEKPIHLIGIGGISMSALASTLLSRGAVVTGSDRSFSPVLIKLEEEGARVMIGHDGKNVLSAAAVIRTAAVHDDNPEIAAAKALSIPILSRAEAWGALMQSYENVLCISGTHGKTTTSAMAAYIALKAGMDPTVMVGGVMPLLQSSYRIGSTRLFIAESCEYCNSFHRFSPTISVLLNIEADHLDFFSGMDEIVDSFKTFALRTPEDGLVVANRDNEQVLRAIQDIPRPVITFGMTAAADVYPANLALNRGYYSFDIMLVGTLYTRVSLKVPGLHNVANTLACAAVFSQMEISGDTFAEGIESFTGAGRRFETLGEYHGAVIVDDYAHHPSEIAATLKTARTMGFDRIFCVFQPHTYTRTVSLFADFASALSLADVPVLAEIYAAREQNKTGISSRDIAEQLDGGLYFPDFPAIVQYLRETLRPGDLCITMGAGNINEVAGLLLSGQLVG